MTAPSHTPGPWAYEPSSGAIYYADGDVEPLIASTNLEGVSEEQADADGRLIAAAPELLRCLQNMVHALNSAMNDESRALFAEKIEATKTAARAAIALTTP